ncbi:MAG: DUF3306 domain-containing protein [Pseudomonadota bacterium]|nr:DUF3306 domain-containing protein [Pseudomonadota bacterium]
MTQKPENDESVLSRWSRRKLDKPAVAEQETVLPVQVQPDTTPTPEKQIVDETEEIPIWQQPDVDPEVKRAALSRLFRQPEFNVVDRMNEYDDDFTSFASLGSIVTHQMKHMLKLAEQKTRPGEKQPDKPELDNMADAETTSVDEQTKHVSQSPNDNEDNEIA